MFYNGSIKDGIWRQRNGDMVLSISGNTFCFIKGLDHYTYPEKGTYSIIKQKNNRTNIILMDENNNQTQYSFTKINGSVAIIIDGVLFTRRRIGGD